MGGVGKTVLAAAVIQDPNVRAAFADGIVWLTLGQAPDVPRLQRRLLAWVTPDAEPPTEVQAGRDTLDTALKSQRWLIILDDVWRQADLRAFEVADTSSRLLITTRDKSVVRASGAVPHVVDELTEPAARTFLAQAVGLAEPNLPTAAKDVVRECGRLPLALALAGATLADDPQDEALWRDLVAALRAADHEDLRAEFDYPYPHPIAAIQASVDFLPKNDKVAYLELAIFPEDTPIPLAPLEKCWGISGLALRNRVKLFVDRALARRQEDGSTLLHDLQRDFVRKRCPDIAAAHNRLLNGYGKDEATAWVDIADDYLLDWLPYHLVGAGRGDESRDLLFDPAWIRRKLAARDVHALIADTALFPNDTEVQRFGRAIRMSAHVVNRDERQLAAQLLGRLSKEDGARTARLLEAAWRQILAGVLVPCGGRHLQSPGALLQTFEAHSALRSMALVDDARALSWSRDGTLRLWDLATGSSRVLEGHSDRATGAVALAKGQRALSWSEDGTLLLWDLETGTSRALEGHSERITGVVVLADGARALSWHWNGTLRLWDLEAGTSRALEGHSDRITGGVVELADGARALSWYWNGTLRLWDLNSDALVETLEGHRGKVVGALALPDGAGVLSWSEDRTLRLWDLKRGGHRIFQGHSDSVVGALVLADGRRVLSWSLDRTLRLWDCESGALLYSFEEHGSAVNGAVVLADDACALSWSADGALLLWDLETGTLSRALAGHSAAVHRAMVLADGARALSWSYSEETLRLWDLRSGEGWVLEGHATEVNNVLLVGHDRALSSSSDGTLRLWDLTGAPPLSLDEGVRRPIRGVVLPDSGHALSWSADSTLRLWNLQNGTHRLLEGHTAVVDGVVLLDENRALSWSMDETLRLWDLQSDTGEVVEGHFGPVAGLVPSKDGAVALYWSSTSNHILRLWNMETGAHLQINEGFSAIGGAILLTDGARALSWSDDYSLCLWDITNRRCLQTLGGHLEDIKGALELPGGMHALSWSEQDPTAHLWDLASGTSRAMEVHDDGVSGAAMFAEGTRAMFWTSNGMLYFWDLKNGALLYTLESGASVSGAVVLADSARALSWHWDGTLRLWDLKTRLEVARFIGDDPLTCCAVREDGRLAVAGDLRGRLMKFDLPS